MTKLIVLVPTRGRPQNVDRLQHAFHALNRADTRLVLGVDADDPELDAYQGLTLHDFVEVAVVEPAGPGMVGALNQLATIYGKQATCLGFMGDDHLPRTEGWDDVLCWAIKRQGGGVAYGNDLVHGANLATAAIMDARIPRELGYMAPPTLRHLYVDNVWMDWGRSINKLAYGNDVIIEHLHPIVGKAEVDERYELVNSGEVTDHDHAAYETYKRDQLPWDKAILEARA